MELVVKYNISVFSTMKAIEYKSFFVARSNEFMIKSSGVNVVMMVMVVAIWVLNDVL